MGWCVPLYSNVLASYRSSAGLIGYPIADALWKDYSDLPETSQEFVDKFHAAVLAEGQIINDDVDLVLLESARSGGWPRSITIKHEHM